MNILVFSWRDPKHPLAGGAEQVMHEHMKGWIKAGHHVTLFSSKIQRLPKKETIDGITVIRDGHQYLGVQIKAFTFFLRNKEKYDLIIDQFHGLPFFTPLYVRKAKLAVIQETAREVWFLNPFPWPLSWLVGTLGYFTEPLIFQLYKNITFMTGSESAKKDVSKFGIPAKNITIVPHGVIVKDPGRVIKEKLFTVTFLGIITKDKGIEDAIKCFEILSSNNRIQFWVIGRFETEEYKSRIMGMLNKTGLKGKVKFWGFVDINKKFELLKKTHVLINPSIREGWGLVNIEANSMGVPVIAYRSQGLIDSVKDSETGIICRHNTPEDLARSVQILLNDQNYFKKLQKSAMKWSANFSWEMSINKSLFLLSKIKNEH